MGSLLVGSSHTGGLLRWRLRALAIRYPFQSGGLRASACLYHQRNPSAWIGGIVPSGAWITRPHLTAKEKPMLSLPAALRLVDGVAIVLSRAYQLARVRLASAASPVLRMMVQRDYAVSEVELLRRECSILRAQRQQMLPHRRPDYPSEQRLAILQLLRLRGWSIKQAAERFVVH